MQIKELLVVSAQIIIAGSVFIPGLSIPGMDLQNA